MTEILRLHPKNPQARLINRTVAMLRRGNVIAYPTDSCYALGCQIGDKPAQERIRRIRKLDNKHDFTLVCRDLSELSVYAKVNNTSFRLLKALTPGPYTFILPASTEVPRRLQNPRRRTIGLRVPDNPVVNAMLEALGEPIMSSTLSLPGEDTALTDPEEIASRLGKQVDLVIDGGHCALDPTTVVELLEDYPKITRYGRGDASMIV